MGSHVTLIDSGQEAARSARDRLFQLKLQAPPGSAGGCRYFVSDSTQDFARLASVFLGETVRDSVERVEIEKY